MIDVEKVDFTKEGGLVPAVIQNAVTGAVLMVGYMNRESLEKTRTEGVVWFFSRSKNRLWMKGETSGNTLKVVDIAADCDGDALLVQAVPAGPVCHTGDETCFGRERGFGFLGELSRIVAQRAAEKDDPSSKSYTVSLFREGLARCAQKVGEEAVEVVIAALARDDDGLRDETADLLFHLLVLLRIKGVELRDVIRVLEQRNR